MSAFGLPVYSSIHSRSITNTQVSVDYIRVLFPKLAEAAGNARGVPNAGVCCYKGRSTEVGPSVFRGFFQGKFRFSKWLFPFFSVFSRKSCFFTIFQAISGVFQFLLVNFFFSVLLKVSLFFRIYESRTEFLE